MAFSPGSREDSFLALPLSLCYREIPGMATSFFSQAIQDGRESVYLSGKCDSILPVKTFSDPNRLVPISLAVKEEGNFSA